MAVNNARNEESRAKWLHMLTPHTGHYISMGDVCAELNVSSSTFSHNVRDLVERGYLTEERFNIRRFLRITPEGEALRDKYSPPPVEENPYVRSPLDAVMPEAVPAAQTIVAAPTKAKVDPTTPYVTATSHELVYLEMIALNLLDEIDRFDPALRSMSMQLRSATKMFQRALETDAQQMQMILTGRRKKIKKVRDY